MDRNTRIRYLGFDDRWLFLFGIPLLGFLIPLLFFRATLEGGLPAYLPEFIVSTVFTAAYWLTVRQIFIYTRRRWPRYEQTRKRLLYTLGGLIVAFFVIHFSLDYVHENFTPPPDDRNVTNFEYMVGSLTIVLLVGSMYEGVFFYSRWHESIAEQERLRRKNIESQLEGLKNQVNPHFLFNSLNTLTYIIPEDPPRAVEFVRKLSKAYRYILEIRDKQLISLREELKFLEAYRFLLHERFGDNLQVRMQVPEDMLEAHIVPLSLQMLFENAIKHNVLSEEKPLLLHVFVDSDRHRLVVRNNLQPRAQAMPSTRVGLENIRSRYNFFSEEEVEVSDADQHFTVSLPLLLLNRPEVNGNLPAGVNV